MNIQLNEGELLGGGLGDFLHKEKAKLGAKWHKLPKWAKILVAGSGIGLLSPTLMTTAITTAGTALAVAIPTALAAGPVAATIFGARKLKKAIEARHAAMAANGQTPPPDEVQHLAAVSEVAAEPIPANAPQTQEAANAATTAAEAATKPKMSLATIAPIAGIGLSLLAFLPKKH